MRDCLGVYVLEWALHHLGLIAWRSQTQAGGAEAPPDESLAAARTMLLERRLRIDLPEGWAVADALRIGTGRSAATPAERVKAAELGPRAGMHPLCFR